MCVIGRLHAKASRSLLRGETRGGLGTPKSPKPGGRLGAADVPPGVGRQRSELGRPLRPKHYATAVGRWLRA